MRTIWTILLVIPVLSVGCSGPGQVTEELRGPLEPGSLRIGMIRYEPLPNHNGADRPPPRTEIYRLQEELRAELAENELFTEVSLSNGEADYILTGEIRRFSDASGYLNFPGFQHTGTAAMVVHLELRDADGTLLFAGDFRERTDSRYGVNPVLYQRIAGDFADALEDQVAEYAGEY